MKKLFIILLIAASNILAQDFVVEKISGQVKVLRGTEEQWLDVKEGQVLLGSDLIVTDEKSFIQLLKGNSRFILNSNSALGLNYIKKVSINELLLALAMEEIRNVPKRENDDKIKSTAVYGVKTTTKDNVRIPVTDLGMKRLNGAKQLAETGYKESAIILAKETYRKYPVTQKFVQDRIYFAELLFELSLYEEVLSELQQIKELTSDPSILESVNKKVNEIREKLISKWSGEIHVL